MHVVLVLVTSAVQEHHGELKHHHPCLVTGKAPILVRSAWSGTPGAKVMRLAGGSRAMHNSEVPCVSVQQGISLWCKYHMERMPFDCHFSANASGTRVSYLLVHSSPTMVCRSTDMQAGSH